MFEFLLLTYITSTCGISYNNFYIKDVITVPHNTTTYNEQMIQIYDINRNMFYFLGETNCREYTYDVKSGLFKFNTTLDTEDWQFSAPSITTIYSYNISSLLYSAYTYFSNSPSGVGEPYTWNFWHYNMQNNSIVNSGKWYPKPYKTFGECYTTDGKQYVYVIGGRNENAEYGIYSKDWFVFDINNHTWYYSNPWYSTLNKGRLIPGCIYVNNALYVVGGEQEDGQTPLSTIEKLEISSNDPINITNSKWKLLNQTLFQFLEHIMVFYPYKNVLTNDNWMSNTIFVIGYAFQWYNGQICNTFNFRMEYVGICSSYGIITNPLPNEISPGIFAYINNEYRYYIFNGMVNGGTTEAFTIQYLLLESDQCSWSANNGQNTLDLNDFIGQTFSAVSDSNSSLFYRYTPCYNMLSCTVSNHASGPIIEMADLYNVFSNSCDQYLAHWNGGQIIPNYNMQNKSWEFNYNSGEYCYNSHNQRVSSNLTIYWNCNTAVSSYQVTSAKYLGDCNHQIIIDSIYGCN